MHNIVIWFCFRYSICLIVADVLGVSNFRKLQKKFYFQVDQKLVRCFSDQIFLTGFVHADPHPGNGMYECFVLIEVHVFSKQDKYLVDVSTYHLHFTDEDINFQS